MIFFFHSKRLIFMVKREKITIIYKVEKSKLIKTEVFGLKSSLIENKRIQIILLHKYYRWGRFIKISC